LAAQSQGLDAETAAGADVTLVGITRRVIGTLNADSILSVAGEFTGAITAIATGTTAGLVASLLAAAGVDHRTLGARVTLGRLTADLSVADSALT